MKKAFAIIVALIAAASCAAMIIESESARKEREVHIALIRDKFDFQAVSRAVGDLVAQTKQVEGVSLLGAKLEDGWQPHLDEFVSGSWWLSYAGGDSCLLTVYFMSTTKALDREGDSALHLRFKLKFGWFGARSGRVVGMRYADYSITTDHLWLSP